MSMASSSVAVPSSSMVPSSSVASGGAGSLGMSGARKAVSHRTLQARERARLERRLGTGAPRDAGGEREPSPHQGRLAVHGCGRCAAPGPAAQNECESVNL